MQASSTQPPREGAGDYMVGHSVGLAIPPALPWVLLGVGAAALVWRLVRRRG
jgi:hypothetical protein